FGDLRIMQLFQLGCRLAHRERCGFQGFQEAGLGLRTDNGGIRLSPSVFDDDNDCGNNGMIPDDHDGRFRSEWLRNKEDKYLIANMIPINLTIAQEEATLWATNASKSMQATDFAS